MPNYVRDITTDNKTKFLKSVSAFDVSLPGLCPPEEFISTGEQCLNFSHGLTRKVFSELSVSPPAIKRKVHKTFRLRRSAPPLWLYIKFRRHYFRGFYGIFPSVVALPGSQQGVVPVLGLNFHRFLKYFRYFHIKFFHSGLRILLFSGHYLF